MVENIEPHMRQHGFNTLVKVLIATPPEISDICSTRSIEITHITDQYPPTITLEPVDHMIDPARWETLAVRCLMTETDIKNTNWLQLPKRISAWISVLLGKMVTTPTLMQANSHQHLPRVPDREKIRNRDLPFYSDKPRIEYPAQMSLNELESLETLVFNTSPEAMRLHSAAEFYANALRYWIDEPEHAYVNLVTAGECLNGFSEYEWSDLADDNAKKISNSFSSNEQAEADKLQRIYEKQTKFIGEKVVRLLTDNLPDTIFEEEFAVDEQCRFTRNDIKRAIKNSYNLRSTYVHTGSTFGVYTSAVAAREKAEVWRDFSMAEKTEYSEVMGCAQEDTLKIISKAATFIGLERIVRHAILRTLANNRATMKNQYEDRFTGPLSPDTDLSLSWIPVARNSIDE